MNRSISLVVGVLALAATACGQATGADTGGDTTSDPAAGACLEGSPECADNPLIVDPTTEACFPEAADCDDVGVPQDTLDETAAPVDEYGPATVHLVLPNKGSVDVNDARTQPITDQLADGVYFSQNYEKSGSTVRFTLTQYFQCDTEIPDEPEVVCASGFGTLDAPITTVDLAADAVITIATGDLDEPTRADVSVTEFVRLVGGEAPAANAPDDFVFTPHFVFVEVRNGEAAAVEQFYVS